MTSKFELYRIKPTTILGRLFAALPYQSKQNMFQTGTTITRQKMYRLCMEEPSKNDISDPKLIKTICRIFSIYEKERTRNVFLEINPDEWFTIENNEIRFTGKALMLIETKAEKYIREKYNSNYQFHVVDKVFGDGKVLIHFFYREQSIFFNQGFLAYVDSKDWGNDRHNVMEEVEEYLTDTIGVIYKDDFAIDMSEDGFTCCIETKNHHYCKNHENEFYQWFKEQFPKIDLEYGGVSYFDEVS